MKTERIIDAVKALESKIIEDRRRFHTDAEIGGNEYKTMEYVLSEMSALGLEPIWVREGLSAIFEFDTEKPGKTLALRADIDALPMQEDEFNLKRKKVAVSKNAGACHACGHDGHCAMLISVARIIIENKADFRGRFVFFFESDEEGSGDFDCSSVFKKYLEEKKPDAIWGIHLAGFMECGKISVQAGPRMASPGMFEIKIIGKGGHGSLPKPAINPVTTAAELVYKLETIIPAQIPDGEVATFAVTSIRGGDFWNIIPETCTVMGNFRCCSQKMYDIFAEQIALITDNVCSANQCKVEYLKMPKAGDVVRPVWNDEGLSGIAEKALDKILPGARVTESVWMAAEPVGLYQKVVPGVFAFVGVMLTVKFASDFMNDE